MTATMIEITDNRDKTGKTTNNQDNKQPTLQTTETTNIQDYNI